MLERASKFIFKAIERGDIATRLIKPTSIPIYESHGTPYGVNKCNSRDYVSVLQQYDLSANGLIRKRI